jgi:hypothetical protein
MACLYGVRNGVFEDCYLTGGAQADSCYLKDSCQNFTRAFNYLDNSGRGLSIGDQNQNGGTSANFEDVYNRVRRTDTSNLAYTWNHAGNATNVGAHWSARNTIQGAFFIDMASTGGVGPYVSENDVVQTSFSPPITTGTRVTITGSELQGSGSYTDSSFNLTGASISYKGTRGYELQ